MRPSEESDDSDWPLEELDWNISNDQYYEPRGKLNPILLPAPELLDVPKYGSSTIQHSLPAYDLWRPFFPTYISDEKFRNFHRPKLRHYNTGPLARLKYRRIKAVPIKNLAKFIYFHQKKLRHDVITAINNGLDRHEIITRYLRVYRAKDLTAKYGELFLFEYSEEHPPVLSQVGMATNIKNYSMPESSFKKYLRNRAQSKVMNLDSESCPNNIEYQPNGTKAADNIICSETTNGDEAKISCNEEIGQDQVLAGHRASKSLYYECKVKEGSKAMFMENNLYRAPIYLHDVPSNDFLVIRTRNSLYIRTVGNIFTVGQTMPLSTVPKPTESGISKFRSKFSGIAIHKLFMECRLIPPFIDFNLLCKLFPDYSPANLRKRLSKNGCTMFKKGDKTFCTIGTSRYGKISLKELRSSFTPENYCLSMSMLAARQRLRELNYTESMINPPNDVEMEPEVQAAPWNTTKAVELMIKGQCYLDLKSHLIDPTGRSREGFSCIPWSRSPIEDQQLKERQSNLYKPSQQVDISKIPHKNPLVPRIRREKLERMAIFQREAQMISDIQANVLASKENLSSDEEGDDEITQDEENEFDNSFDEQLKDLDKLVLDGRTIQQLGFEKEEEERIKMLEEFHMNSRIMNSTPIPEDHELELPMPVVNVKKFKNKILKITRMYDTEDGRIQRTELVRDPKIIALYVKEKSLHVGNKGDDLNKSESRSIYSDHSFNRSRRSSLGPSELCRADGTILTISKLVLNQRAMRKINRDGRTSESSNN